MDFNLLFDGILGFVKNGLNLATGSVEGVFANFEFLFNTTSSALSSK